jgi:flagellum-specific peptidoglycan hydrolase FlgJ
MESAENQTQPSLGEKPESNIKPPLSKTETIALLNDSIDRLEETIKKISQDSAQIPSSDSINILLTTTQELENAVTPVSEVKPDTPTSTLESTTQQNTSIQKPPAIQNKNKQNTQKTSSAKTSTPKAKKTIAKKKSNTGLIVIGVTAIAIAIVTVFWLWKPPLVAKLFPKAEPIPKVAVNLDTIPEQSPVAPLIDSPENLNNPARPDNLDDPAPTTTGDFPTEIEQIAEPIDDVVKTIIPPELTSPGKPKKLKIVTIKPELKFTPEQNLIAALETKLGELAQAYPTELIQDIKVNLSESNLLVEVTDDWYALDELRQNSLGKEMLQRSRTLGFDKLELKDKMGALIARNPIIGENIIILQSKKQQLAEN